MVCKTTKGCAFVVELGKSLRLFCIGLRFKGIRCCCNTTKKVIVIKLHKHNTCTNRGSVVVGIFVLQEIICFVLARRAVSKQNLQNGRNKFYFSLLI